MTRARGAVLVILALVLGCGDDSKPTEPAPVPAPQTRIVFESSRDGNSEIYVMNADGTDQRRLTFDAVAFDTYPSWYPDHRHIIFTKENPYGNVLYRMNDDGSDPVLIDSIPGSYYLGPRVSPDGTKIVYSWSDGVSQEALFVVTADGSITTMLTNDIAAESDPDWSPDGTRIVYARGVPNLGWRIYTMRSDGTDTLRISPEAGSFQLQPRWSPDGSMIAYVTWKTGTPFHYIYVMNADGSNARPVSPLTDAVRLEPSWSPDGSKIAYRDGEGDGAEILTIGLDGQGMKNVTNTAGRDYTPDWGPGPAP